jgi:uncharacterized Rmd1/YagE family protein
MAEQPDLSPLAGRTSVRVRALFLGERLDLRTLENVRLLASAPMIVEVRGQGCAVLFRYGVVVLFDVPPLAEVEFLSALRPLLSQPFEGAEVEEAQLRLGAEARERIEGDVVWLPAFSVERLQLVAEVLARAVVLDRYEGSVEREFDRIEPLALGLKRRRFTRRLVQGLLEHIGGVLLSQQRMVGRVALSEKPELLWDHPQLERFYARLEDEYELRERHAALEEKMKLISRTAETVLGLLHARRSLRVEWYIVILIVVEILLTLYELFLHS